MKIGLIIAVENEFKSFAQSEFKSEIIEIKNRKVHKFYCNNNEIYVLKSGCGQIDASSATQFLISTFDVELIMNFGVVGALNPELKVNDLFIVEKTVNIDFDTSSIDNVVRCQYGELPDMYVPLDLPLVNYVKELFPHLKNVICASGERFVDKKEDKDSIREYTKADIVDMEIVGIARTCFTNGVKCLSIKCISDTYQGDGGDFIENVTKSSAKAFEILKELFYKI